jgi:uncharacterized protein (TIGR02246 family)
MTADEREVWTAVETMYHYWTAGDPRELARHFHPRMVAVTPADDLPLVGGEACAAAWARDAATVRIRSWRTRGERVAVFGDAAVVTYLYEMECETEGRTFRPRGRDLLALVREDGRWRVVADHFSPSPRGPEA